MQLQKILNSAIEFQKAGRLEEAYKLYLQVAQQAKNNQQVLNILSIAFLNLGNSYWDRDELLKAKEFYLS